MFSAHILMTITLQGFKEHEHRVNLVIQSLVRLSSSQAKIID